MAKDAWGRLGERETERKTTTWLLVRLYGCTGASGSIVQRRVRCPATQGHRWPLGKYAAMAKGAWDRPDSTDAYSPSIPGYMTGCSFPLTDCQKMFRKPRETSNGKRCLEPTGREGNRKENDDLAPRQVIWLYGSFRKHRAAQSTASSHPRSSVAARKICGNGKRCLGQPDTRMLILLRSRDI